jgi:hypothetical protein
MAQIRGLSPKAWSGAASDFHKMYRERRLEAQRAGRAFPYLPQARIQLAEAVQIARARGEVNGINEFWDYVFRPPQPSETKLRRHWGAASKIRQVKARQAERLEQSEKRPAATSPHGLRSLRRRRQDRA